MLPILAENKNYYSVLISNKSDNKLKFIKTKISNKFAVQIPLEMTPKNFVKVIRQTFGIWLPRNSSDQGAAYPLINLDIKKANDRLDILMDNGCPFLDFIQFKGRIFIYLGKTYNL